MRQVVDAATGAPLSLGLLTAAGSLRRPVCWAELWFAGEQTGVRVRLTGCGLSWAADRLHQCDGTAEWSGGFPVDPQVVPGGPGSLVVAGVTELSVWAGLSAGGVDAVCQVGVFAVTECGWDGATVTVRLGSRSERFSRAKLEQPVSWAATSSVEGAVAAMLDAAWTDVPMVFEGDAGPAPVVVHETETDPWRACTDAATQAGCRLFHRSDGAVLWTPEADRDGAEPEMTFAAGVNLIGPERTMGVDGYANRTFVPSTKADLVSPVVGVATFTEPGSPYRYGGDFGAAPQWFPSDLPATLDAANASATTIQQATRPADTIRWSAPLVACLELADPVRVVWPAGWVDRVVWPQEIGFDLTGDTMSVTAGEGGRYLEGVL